MLGYKSHIHQPLCLWSLRIFHLSPVLVLRFFGAMRVQHSSLKSSWWNFAYSHKILVFTRIELTTSALLVSVRGYLLDHSLCLTGICYLRQRFWAISSSRISLFLDRLLLSLFMSTSKSSAFAMIAAGGIIAPISDVSRESFGYMYLEAICPARREYSVIRPSSPSSPTLCACMYARMLCMVITYSRVWINWVRLPTRPARGEHGKKNKFSLLDPRSRLRLCLKKNCRTTS